MTVVPAETAPPGAARPYYAARGGVTRSVHALFMRRFVFGLGQPRYGAGALITAGAESLAWLIRTQPRLKYPIGHVLHKVSGAS